jgi:Ca2+-binding EF-hand superfamily protein
MSIAGIGSNGPGNLSQVLSSLLSRLDTTKSTSATADATESSQSNTAVGSDGNLIGSTKPSLSSMIMGTLLGLQQQNGGSTSQASSSQSTAGDPIESLFSAMDSDSDGAVTQSELESYLTQLGGTQEQADSLFNMLNTSGSSSGLTEDQLASQAPPAPPSGPPPGGGQGGGPGGPPPSQGGASSDEIGSALLQTFDANSDGSVSESEFADYVTSNGGTADEASTDFAALDTEGSGSLTASNFADAVQKLQDNFASGSYSPLLTLLDMFAGNGTAAGGSLSLTV